MKDPLSHSRRGQRFVRHRDRRRCSNERQLRDLAGVALDAVRIYETGFNENNHNTRQWELPNMVGLTRIDGGR